MDDSKLPTAEEILATHEEIEEQSYRHIADGGGALLFSALTGLSGVALLALWVLL